MSDSIASPKSVKRCSCGDECIHPDGPVLPRTAEYFYMRDGNKASAKCKECQKAYRIKWYNENIEEARAKMREYARTHPEVMRRGRVRRRLRVGGDEYLRFDELNALFKQQNGNCWWCGAFVGLEFEVDHRVPVEKGGKHEMGNLVISCVECNRKKGNRPSGVLNGRLL